MFGFDWLAPYTIYVALSAIVAVLIYVEGEMLKKSDGKLPKSSFFHFSSFTDTIWFFISTLVIYVIEMPSLALSVPAAYGIYTIGGWIYGSRLLRQKGLPDSLKDLVIPKSYIAYSQSFAIIFFNLCILVLVLPRFVPAVLE